MKKIKKIIEMLCILILTGLLLTACGAGYQTADDPILFSVGGNDYTVSAVKKAAETFASQGQIADQTDYAGTIHAITRNAVEAAIFTEAGFDAWSNEEEARFNAEAEVYWNEALEGYAAEALSKNENEKPREALLKEGEAYYNGLGLTLESITEQVKYYYTYDRLKRKLFTASESEIQSVYNQKAAEYRLIYADNIPDAEFDRDIYGVEMLYYPKGFRGMLFIKLKSDNPQSASDPEGAMDVVLAEKQETIDAIYAGLNNGESFEDLAKKYSDDPYLDEILETGIPVHRDSMTYDQTLTDAAFGKKMQKVGDVSEPVVTSDGIYILYYLRDIPEGAAPMSETIRTECESDVLDTKLKAYRAQKEKEMVQYNPEAITMLLANKRLQTSEG